MCHRIRTCVLISLGVAGCLALAPATAEAQRGRAIAQFAANEYLGGGYGYGYGYPGGYGYPRYYGGYTTSYGVGYRDAGLWNGYINSYPVYGYNNSGYGYGYGGGYPAYGYGGIRRSAFGRAMTYGYQPVY
jgi:hypothetical protein